MEPLEQRLRLLPRLALDRRGHQRSRGPGDRAARALERDVADHVAIQLEPDRQLVAAERVVPFGPAVGVVHDPVVPGRAVVLQDDVLVELGEARHQPNTFRARSTPSHQGIDLVRRVVEGEGRSDGGRDAEPLHHRLRAVVSRPYGDALVVEHRAHVVRVNALQHEREHAGLLPRGADQPDAGSAPISSVARARSSRSQAAIAPSPTDST